MGAEQPWWDDSWPDDMPEEEIQRRRTILYAIDALEAQQSVADAKLLVAENMVFPLALGWAAVTRLSSESWIAAIMVFFALMWYFPWWWGRDSSKIGAEMQALRQQL